MKPCTGGESIFDLVNHEMGGGGARSVYQALPETMIVPDYRY